MSKEIQPYTKLLCHIRQRVVQAQQRAIYSANEEMLRMYWDIGEMLINSQKADGWGKKTLERLSVDLKNEFPKIKGFSVRNMQCMMQFYEEYNKELTLPKLISSEITQSPIAQLPTYNFELPVKHLSWTHNVVLIQKVKDIRARYWYMIQCVKSNWKVDYLKEVITRDEYGKHGALANNFAETLPMSEAREVSTMLKDPYIFDMLTFTEEYNERDVEIGLVKHVDEVSGDDYYIDLLMYNAFMHRYLVVELKNTEFKPEYIGKLNFYCSAVDDILCREGDNRTIGLLLCKTKDKVKAEYALRDIIKPIGISDYELGQVLPNDFRGSLPTIEEIENEFEKSGNWEELK